MIRSQRHLALLLPFLLLACGKTGPADTELVQIKGGRVDVKATAWLELSETQHEFGDVWHGDRPSHSFFVKNRGPQRIRLIGTRNACTCAYLQIFVRDQAGKELAREVHQPAVIRDGDLLITWIEPGEQLEARITVDTLVRPPEDHKEPGETILSFQPREAGEVRFGYFFHIRPRVLVAPQPSIALDPFGKEQQVPQLLSLRPAPKQKPFAITKVEGLGEHVKLEQIPALEKGEHRYLLQVGPLHSAGNFERILRFHTDLANGYTARVVLQGRVLPNLLFVPAKRLDYGRIDFARATKSFVTLRYLVPNREPEITLGTLEAEDGEGHDVSEWFQPKLRKDMKGTYTLTLAYKGGHKARLIRGRVLVKTDDNDHLTTWVPFTAFHRGN